MSSARERPTRDVMVSKGVSCFRDSTRMEGCCCWDGCSESGLAWESDVASLVEDGSVFWSIGGSTASTTDDAGVGLEGLSTSMGTAVVGVASSRVVDLLVPVSGCALVLVLLSSPAATASRMNPSHTRARYRSDS